MAFTFEYNGLYTITFEEENVYYPGLTDNELSTLKKEIEREFTPSELEDILVEGDVTSWEGAELLGIRLQQVKLESTPQRIRLGDYFDMKLVFQAECELSDVSIKRIRKALRKRFDAENTQLHGFEFGRQEVALLV